MSHLVYCFLVELLPIWISGSRILFEGCPCLYVKQSVDFCELPTFRQIKLAGLIVNANGGILANLLIITIIVIVEFLIFLSNHAIIK